MNYLDLLKEQFNHHVPFREKRPGVMQLVAPLYYEDGDFKSNAEQVFEREAVAN